MLRSHHYTKGHHNLYGIIFMLLHAVSISILYLVIKELRRDLDSNLIVFLYKLTVFICVLPWVFSSGWKAIKTKRLKLHFLRGFLSICGSLCLFYAIKYIDLANMTAIGYLEQVLLVIIGILYFRESATVTKILSIIISFIGALVVIYPDIIIFDVANYSFHINYQSLKGFNKYYFFVFFSILFWVINCVVVKILGRTEKTKVQLFYVMLFSCIFTFPIAFFDWQETAVLDLLVIKYPAYLQNPETLGLKQKHLVYIIILAFCYFIHSVAFFKAFKYAELSVIVPFDYSRLVFAGILGYTYFSEVPQAGSYLGYILIVLAGVSLIRSESKRRLKAKEKLLEAEIENV